MAGKAVKTTEEELKRVVKEAMAEKFMEVGIIAHDDDAIADRRRDFDFLHDLRTSTESAKGKVATGFLLLAVGGVAAWMITGFKLWAKQG